IFFFSSRRRHTRFSRDWSSDVCSSDLARELQQVLVSIHPSSDQLEAAEDEKGIEHVGLAVVSNELDLPIEIGLPHLVAAHPELRSEERRVGKECRSRWWRCPYSTTCAL